MALKAAFIFISQDGNPEIHHNEVATENVSVTTVAVRNYAEAATLATKLVDEGIIAIELCGGFGIEGVAMVKQAVKDRAVAGVVRFDLHPGLGHQSGDEIFR